MKSYLLSLTVLFLLCFSVTAQNYDPVKTQLMLNQFEKAKTDLDKAFNNPKYSSKPEAFILKSIIYSGLANTEAKKGTPEAEQLLSESDAAFTKFKEMDPAMTLLNDALYQNAAVYLYSNYYTNGYNDYSKKNWSTALDKLKKAVSYSDILIKYKMLNATLDTNVLILAAITAESGNFKDDARMYYQKLADAKVGGEGFEPVYRFLISDAFSRKDMEAFERYKSSGKELYPTNEYFDYDKVDFAVGLVTDLFEKVKALEELLITDPDNLKANLVLGEILSDTLDPRKQEGVFFENYAVLEKKMVDAFMRAAKTKPEDPTPFLYIGDFYARKGAIIDERRDQHARDMKARAKPGVTQTKESAAKAKEDLATKAAMDKEYAEVMEKVRSPYESAAAIFDAKAELTSRDKQQYKVVAGYLADIANLKKEAATKVSNTAEINKWTAAEKKWNLIYDSIKL